MDCLNDKNLAFLFQGVGSEYQKFIHLLDQTGMILLNQCCDLVNKEIHLDLWNYLKHDQTGPYDKQFCGWIAIYTCDYVVYRSYMRASLKPRIFAGYSMGLITAMACGLSVTFEDGLHMLLKIYEYPMHTDRKKEAMAVIIGLDAFKVEAIISGHGLRGEVDIASENSEFCIVISGLKRSICRIIRLAEEEGAIKVKRIEVPYAFHSHFARNGIEEYTKLVDSIHIKDSVIPIISVLNQEILKKSSDLEKELIKNMAGRMNWRKSIEKLVAMGITDFIGVSLDDSLIKISKLIDCNCRFLTYKKIVPKGVMEKVGQ